MILSALIKKGGLAKIATVTSATVATQEAGQAGTVATVATVAVTERPEPPQEQAIPSTFSILSTDEEASIRAWLAHIEESDLDIIDDVLGQCRTNPESRRFYLKQAEKIACTTVPNAHDPFVNQRPRS